MTAAEKYKAPEGLTPEKVWEMFYANEARAEAYRAEWEKRQEEYRAEWEKRQAEADRRQAEADQRQAEADQKRELEKAEFERRQAELDRKWAKTMEAWDRADRRIESGNKKIGGLENTFGELMEHLVAPGIEKRFQEIGIDFELTAHNFRLKEGRRCIAEIDLLLENDRNVMAVEVKAKPRVDDMEKHAKRLETLRGYYAKRGDSRKIFGAIAGAVFGRAERKAALGAGFFVLTQSGDTMRMDIPDGFEPKAW
ncbi:MAG: hypothetical protein FWE09_03710 [Treponema sp.]|nr:hypothetical protein [Treponema sp.]